MSEVQYATLLPQVNNDLQKEKNAPADLTLLGKAIEGSAGLMIWKVIILKRCV